MLVRENTKGKNKNCRNVNPKSRKYAYNCKIVIAYIPITTVDESVHTVV